MRPSRRSRLELERSVVIVAGLFALGGCTSTARLESLQTQVEGLQTQLERLQEDTATRDTLQGLQDTLLRKHGELAASAEVTRDELSSLTRAASELTEALHTVLDRIDILSRQVASNHEELQSLGARQPTRTEGGRAPIDATDPEDLYSSAYLDYQAGNYELALLGFGAYLDNFPDAEQADNALYWTGESYFAQRRYSPAIEAFGELLERYPASEKAASARLRQGYSLIERGDLEEGLARFREVVRDHSSSAEADFARDQLRELEPED